MSGATKLEDHLDDEELEEDDQEESEPERESDDANFYETKPDILYEVGDDQPYESAVRSTEFLLISRVFLEEELIKLLVHHQIQLNDDESAERIAKEAFELAEEMSAKKMWPAKLGVKAALRIALKKIVYFKYKKDFELSGIAKIRVQRTIPSVGEQMARNKALIEVWNVAKNDTDLRSIVMDLGRNSLKMQLLPEAFNRNTRGDIAAEQINDLVVNWLFSLDAEITEKHKVLLVLMLCKSFDQQSLYAEYARAYELKESVPELKREVDQLSADLQAVFDKATDADFQNFLRTNRIDGRESGHKKRHHNEETENSRGASSSSLVAYLRDLRGESGTDKIESNPKGLALRYIDLAKAKSGDFTARNNFVRTTLRLAVDFTKNNSGATIDNLAQANLVLLEKAIGYDFRSGFSVATYLTRWVRSASTRRTQEDRDVRIPIHVLDFIGSFERFWWTRPGLERSQALDLFAAKNGKSNYAKKMKEARFLTNPMSLDKPIGEDETSTFGDIFIPDKSEMASFGEVVERVNFRDKIEMAVDCLPPLLGVLTRLRMGMIPGGENEKFTLSEVGGLFGVSRERVRQIEEIVISGLKSASTVGMGKGSYYLKDEKMFAAKMAEMGLEDWQVEAVKMVMGFDAGKLYKKYDLHVVVMVLKSAHSVATNHGEVKRICRRVKANIDQSPERFGLVNFSEGKAFKYARMILRSLYEGEPMSEDLVEEIQNHLKLLEGAMQRIDWKKLLAEKVDHGEELQNAKVVSKSPDEVPDLIRTEVLGRTSEVLSAFEAKHLPIANAILAGRLPKEIANDLQIPLGKVMVISARVKMLVANNSK